MFSWTINFFTINFLPLIVNAQHISVMQYATCDQNLRSHCSLHTFSARGTLYYEYLTSTVGGHEAHTRMYVDLIPCDSWETWEISMWLSTVSLKAIWWRWSLGVFSYAWVLAISFEQKLYLGTFFIFESKKTCVFNIILSE